MQDKERLTMRYYEERKRVQIANIKEELDLFQHDLPALNTVYLILEKMRIE